MKFDVRHLSVLRSQGLLAARAAMSRSRQAGLGMVAALVLAGQMSGLHSAGDKAGKDASISPSAMSYIRAVEQGLTYPAAAVRRDIAMAFARREAASIVAGFSGSVTAVAAEDLSKESVEPNSQLDTDLPKSIAADDDRIDRPSHRSKAGEAISVNASLLERVQRSSGSGVGPLASISESAAADEPANEIHLAMLRLAQEAHGRHGRPAMSAQAMSEYLSLYAMRERVADIGRALANGVSGEDHRGLWVANLGDAMDDALFQSGLGLGQDSYGAIAGLDSVVQNVFSSGDKLVYGGFASAYGLTSLGKASDVALKLDTRGASFGVFGVLDDGPFSVSGMLRADFSESFDPLASNRLDVSTAMQVLKAEVVARYRFDVSDWTVEPSAGLAFASGRREIVGLTPSSPRVEESESLKIQLGVKASGVVYNRAGTSVEPSVTIMISEELRDNGDIAYLGGAPNSAGEPLRGKTIGSVSIGVDVKDDSGWVGFVRADGQVSDDDKPSAGVSAGVKTQW